MNTENRQLLFSSPLVRLEKVCCLRARKGMSCEECKTEHQISIPLSGANVRHIGRETYTMSSAHVTLSNRGEEYRVSHPYGSGETQLNIVLQEEALLQLLMAMDPHIEKHHARPFQHRQLPATTKLHLAVQCLSALSQSPASSDIEIEAAIVALVAQIAGMGIAPASAASITQRDAEIAQQAQALLATQYTRSLTLQDAATSLGISVYHLCRVFRRATGESLWSQIQKLRTRAALLQLQDRTCDLTNLGLALGYAHHSHFTASFRRQVGITPSAARRLFESGSLAQVRELLASIH